MILQIPIFYKMSAFLLSTNSLSSFEKIVFNKNQL